MNDTDRRETIQDAIDALTRRLVQVGNKIDWSDGRKPIECIREQWPEILPRWRYLKNEIRLIQSQCPHPVTFCHRGQELCGDCLKVMASHSNQES